MGEPTDLTYIILPLETPLQLWVEVLGVPEQMQEAMVFGHHME